MPITIPAWAIGKHITTVLLAPQTLTTVTGTLQITDSTSYAMFGHLRDISLKKSFTMEEISSMDRRPMNYIITQDGHEIDMTEIEKQVGTNLAAAITFGSADYGRFSIVRGAQTWGGYGVFGDYGMSSAKERVDASFSMRPIDVSGASAISYS